MTKGYLSLAKVAARWDVCEDTARERLKDCPRIRLGRAVRYSIEGVEDIEREVAVYPASLRVVREKRRVASASAERAVALRRELGLV